MTDDRIRTQAEVAAKKIWRDIPVYVQHLMDGKEDGIASIITAAYADQTARIAEQAARIAELELLMDNLDKINDGVLVVRPTEQTTKLMERIEEQAARIAELERILRCHDILTFEQIEQGDWTRGCWTPQLARIAEIEAILEGAKKCPMCKEAMEYTVQSDSGGHTKLWYCSKCGYYTTEQMGGNPYIDEVSELEADKDIAAGRVKTFENVDELMDDLKDEKNPGEYAGEYRTLGDRR